MNRCKGDLGTRIRRAAKPIMLVLMAGSVVALASCSKKQPPPAPVVDNTPPPPPPPENVSFEAISQEMQADPRVQFASNLEVSDEKLARAVVRLADAIARGDASKLRAVVNADSKKVITALENDGTWGEQMNNVEAVRVVYAAPYDSAANKVTLEKLVRALMEAKEGEDLPMGITPDAAYAVGAMIGSTVATKGEPIKSREDLNKFWRDMESGELVEKFLSDAQYEEQRRQMELILAGPLSATPYPNGNYLVLLAVQDKDGAQLSGWGAEEAFGGLEFNIGNTVATVKPSASAFDGTGLRGFAASGRVLAQADEEDSGKPPAEKKDESGSGDAPKDEGPKPGEKRTPAGPVQIPGGG
ncbi:MAG: hypothetical protein AB7G11_13435 [Phycisphaerales bacterium]